MKRCTHPVLIFLLVQLLMTAPLFAKEQSASPQTVTPKVLRKGAQLAKPKSFKVNSVQFNTVLVNNKSHLAAAVIFNQNIDAATVQQNVNIRLLKQNANNFWVDVSTQNNTVRIRPNFITWLAGVPLENGKYKMHLRGTIQSTDGMYLDCNGDGVGERGNLPAYESQVYLVNIPALEESNSGQLIPGLP